MKTLNVTDKEYNIIVLTLNMHYYKCVNKLENSKSLRDWEIELYKREKEEILNLLGKIR